MPFLTPARSSSLRVGAGVFSNGIDMEINFLLMMVGVAGGLLAIIQLWSDNR